ncbi:MAG: oligosaccharide flippase family protein [Deltaproteobacteria bacterium]|nr:oligosaccharide flippase family protein [Deltaproteobacteria bacterium]
MRKTELGSSNMKSSSKKRIGKAFSISVLNQIISSATNFGINIILVRTLSKTEFGLYGICFAALLFITGITDSLLTTQMVVLSPEKPEGQRKIFATSVYELVVLTTFGIAVLLLLGSHLLSPFSSTVANFLPYIYPLAFASLFFSVKFFFLRYFYSIKKEIYAFVTNLILSICVFLLFVADWVLTSKITLFEAIFYYGLAHLIAIVAAHHLSRFKHFPRSATRIKDALGDTWKGGKWASITNVAFFLRIQAHTLIVASTIDIAGVAQMNAARLFVTPGLLLIPAVCQIALPRMADIRAYNIHAFKKSGIFLSIAFLSGMSLYVIALMLLWPFIQSIVGETYHNIGGIVQIWCLFGAAIALRNSLEVMVQSLKEFKFHLSANLIGTVITLVSVTFFSKLWSISGAILGLFTGEICLAVFYFYRIQKLVR